MSLNFLVPVSHPLQTTFLDFLRRECWKYGNADGVLCDLNLQQRQRFHPFVREFHLVGCIHRTVQCLVSAGGVAFIANIAFIVALRHMHRTTALPQPQCFSQVHSRRPCTSILFLFLLSLLCTVVLCPDQDHGWSAQNRIECKPNRNPYTSAY